VRPTTWRALSTVGKRLHRDRIAGHWEPSGFSRHSVAPLPGLEMNDHNLRPRMFYGWWVALTAALGLFLNTATVVVFPFGIFARAIGQEFHSGRARISLAFTFHNLMAAICIPLAGRLVDRYGARRVLLPFTFLLALILIASSVISNAIWELYVFYLLLGVVSGGAGVMPYTDVVSQWFDRRRGLALSVMLLGMGLGAPENLGLLPDGPADVHPAAAAPGTVGLTLREALQTSEFWTMISALILVTASVHACFIHLPAILTDRGSTAQTAAFVSSLLGLGLFLGRVGCGYLLDHFFAPRVAALVFSGVALGVAVITTAHSLWLACVAALLVGLGIGAEVDIIGYLTTRYFGLRSFGEIFGWIFAVFSVSGGLGAYLMGVGFDKTGSYKVPLAGFFCAALLSTLLMTRLGPYRYRARMPDSDNDATPVVAVAPTRGGQ
jgi:MFS family permease